MIRSSIDLGTNTCLLLIVEWDPKKRVITRILRDEATVVRLGEGVDQTRQLQAAPMERVLVCLKEYAETIELLGSDPAETICVATSQARDAKNSVEFFVQIKSKFGLSFRTLSGDQEAHFTFLGGLLSGMDPAQSAIIDIGGGSTEIISSQGGQSVDLGSVRYTERFFKSNPVTDEEFWNCQEAVDQALQPFQAWRKKQADLTHLVAVAGTATTLAAWHLNLKEFDSNRVDSTALSRGDVHRMVEELKWRTVEERRQLPCMEPMRADVLLAGSMILWRMMEILDFKECIVSSRGLRYGLILEA
jgi:exopolyphosphatase/guanosine-5'-triphosphate,3'-diphosphate pyrophosphatase